MILFLIIFFIIGIIILGGCCVDVVWYVIFEIQVEKGEGSVLSLGSLCLCLPYPAI